MKIGKTVLNWLDAMRWHQWNKGLWLLLPLVGKSDVSGNEVRNLLIGLVLITLISGGVYINNDIADKEKDAAHPTKKHRPFASGTLRVREGVVAIWLLWGAACLMIVYLGNIYVAVFGVAMILGNIVYTRFIKHLAYAELVFYALLFPLRYWIGAVLVKPDNLIAQSLFVMSFSVFFLALLRYSEKTRLDERVRTSIKQYSAPVLMAVVIIMAVASLIAHYWTVAFLGIKAIVMSVILAVAMARYIVLAIVLSNKQGGFAEPDAMFILSRTLMACGLFYVIAVLL